jgi:hypothetical protein
LEVAVGALLLLTSEVNPGLLGPIVAGWGAVSGILLLAQGLRLRRFAGTWRQASGTPPKIRSRTLGSSWFRLGIGRSSARIRPRALFPQVRGSIGVLLPMALLASLIIP